MTNYEMVELLRSKANVTYEEAKAALEASNWDILDAMVLLERQGKVKDKGAAYSTAQDGEDSEAKKKENKNAHWEFEVNGNFMSAMRRFGRWLRKLIQIGNANFFVVSRHGEEILSLPVTVLVVLLPFLFVPMLILLVVGLFTDFRYSFRGPNLGSDAINDTISKASDMADSFKAEVIHGDGEEDSKK